MQGFVALFELEILFLKQACFLVDGVCSFGFGDLIWLLRGF